MDREVDPVRLAGNLAAPGQSVDYGVVLGQSAVQAQLAAPDQLAARDRMEVS